MLGAAVGAADGSWFGTPVVADVGEVETGNGSVLNGVCEGG